MAIYIVRPKITLLGRFPDLAARKITAEKREAEIQEVVRLWQKDTTYQKIRSWLEEAKGREVHPVSVSPSYPTITGAIAIEMSQEECDRLRRDVDNIVILENEPLELIPPIQDSTTAKMKLEVEDVWHLEAISKSKTKETGKNVTIAVFDTGIEAKHPELQGKVSASYSLNLKRDIRQLQIEPTTDEDTDGHGTHVAGLICGNTVGVAPQAELINVVMIPNRRGGLLNFITALEWLQYRPDVRLVNISAGIQGYRQEMSEAIDNLLAFGILPICAIGNEGRNSTRTPGNCPKSLSVGATNRQGKVAGFSGSSTMVVDNHLYNVPSLVAPGEAVYSSVMTGGYEAWDGTSMATPIVSGVAALIIEEEPTISVDDLREALLDRCLNLGVGVELERQGRGIIQVKL